MSVIENSSYFKATKLFPFKALIIPELDSAFGKSSLNACEKVLKRLKKGINILLVDSNKSTLYILEHALQSPLINIKSVNSFAAAKEFRKNTRKQINCCVAGLELDGNNAGLLLLPHMSKFNYVILLSNHAKPEIICEALQKGAFSVYGKEFASLPNLQDKICKVAALGFVCNGRKTRARNYLTVLFDNRIKSISEWCDKAFISQRSLETFCSDDSGLPPKYFFPLYYTIYYLLRYTCPLIDDNYDDLENTQRNQMISHFSNCVDFIANHLGKIESLR